MGQVCEICGKHKAFGGHITRRGLAKKKGGIGMHVVKVTKREFKPNLKSVRAVVNGGVKRLTVCTACLRSGKVVMPCVSVFSAFYWGGNCHERKSVHAPLSE